MEKDDVSAFVLKVEEIAKVGLKYSHDPYAIDNYALLQNIAHDFIVDKLGIDLARPNFFARDIYPTPNISVRTVIFNKDRTEILLVQERSDGGYSLPGGWAELNLSPSASALKEVREEAGIECRLIRLIGLLDRYGGSRIAGVPEYIAAFLGEAGAKISEPCHEIISCGYFPLSALPSWSVKNNPAQMERLIKAALSGETSFD